ncbi:6-phosphogluconolactonase [Salinisphaera sp. Q1T1-3]|uniref:6-phosphogluconolactonase n=1 Tax=Salinisphaera sp. Q1T1-3 TaxID=2321229 RepID=UPI000E717754|nr:6-phosphogluconolactonase [Salinisphaera sp. Q1T1-3]RJS93104.1 6-phosphogluconolactonase [Salinisphaera sp. Q1T1-3]
MSEFTSYDSRKEAAETLAASIAESLRVAIAERGQASLVVCGGSSPLELFEHLSATELDWSRVTVVPSDERWVAVDDAQSNERMIRDKLLTGLAADAHFVSLHRDTETPAAAVESVTRALADIPRPFDGVLLGMGGDGHTASLFPHASDIDEAVASDAACIPADVGPPARLSLGLSVLTDARRIDVLIFGDDKQAVYERARHDGPIAELPIRGILNTQSPTATVHWAA